jgi:hypothetical protein
VRRLYRCRTVLALALGVLLWLPSAVWAQSPSPVQPQWQGALRNQVPATSGVLSVPPGGMSVPAEPDTALGLVTGPSGWPEPVNIYLWPHSLRYGDVAALVIDFPKGTEKADPDSIRSLTDWLVIAGRTDSEGAEPRRGLWGRLTAWLNRRSLAAVPPPHALPPADGVRLITNIRVYWPGPFRLGWSSDAAVRSSVHTPASLLGNSFQPAAIRHPRSLGWSWPSIGLLVVAILAVACLWWLFRRRRSRPMRPDLDLPIPPPAYLLTAQELWRLYEEQLPAKGQGRLFLDRFSAVLRSYLAARFRIRAAEMIPPEIAAALQNRGYSTELAAAFAALLEGCDIDRYRPGGVTAERCRRYLLEGLEMISQTKVAARYTPLPAELSLRGEQCWSRLRKLDLGPAAPGDPVAVMGGRP